MKFSTLVFAIGASAATIRRDQCSFTITASGGQSGVVGQLSDGQNRIDGGHPTGTYTISNGQITDAAGRGCILTPSVEQFQCDSGATPTSGFSIGSSGEVLFSGSSTFYACAASDSEYNIYTTPVSGQEKCYEVELSASGCYGSSHASSVAPSSVAPSSVAPSSVAPSSVATPVPGTTILQTTTQKESAPAPTIYKTTTQEETTTQQLTQKQTVTEETTKTEQQSASIQTVYITQTSEQTAAPSTVYITQTQEQSASAQTVYITQTQEQSASVQTVYITQTNEETAAPSTVTITQEQSAPVQTVYITQTQEQSAPAETVTRTQVQTQAPQTITETAQASCEAQTITEQPSTQTLTYTQPGQSTTLIQTLSTTISQVSQATPPASISVTPISSPISEAPSHSTSAPQSSQIPSSSIPVTSQATSSPTSSTPSASSSSCPTNLNGEYQYPHLIVPVSSASPSTAYGTSYNGVVNSTVSSIFNFDIPSSYTGTCSLIFLFPTQDQLETSSYTFSGNGDVDFAQLSTIATQSTTYGSVGSVEKDFGTFTVTPGSSTVISTFACPAGETVSYDLSEGASGTTDLWFFQDYNPSPLGLYITTC
ncbi:gpi anchored cell wall protein [Rutstroemia sp. NJR-2017a WRK4]|nr:gpi anchored cell wall protein [Rutstroemia sp. NJR-2017a WRK4]